MDVNDYMQDDKVLYLLPLTNAGSRGDDTQTIIDVTGMPRHALDNGCSSLQSLRSYKLITASMCKSSWRLDESF